MPLAEGQVIAGYTILRSVGAGGMGEVYLAQHPRLPRHDALKVLSATVCADDEYRQRFNREAEIAATLWHPHIVSIHDRGDIDGQLWIAMDYVEGTDAAQLLAEKYRKGMPPALVIRMITAVAEALDYAHQKGLTHRDVKPANILIANPDLEGERIMLADFGIARRADDTSKLTGTNMTVGTVSYAAPEQLTGETVDGRADQYALAATAYELLTGSPPFKHSNPAVVISQHLTASPPPIGSRRPELSDLGPAFDRALAKSPAERFDRCVDFARALGHGIGSEAGAWGDIDQTMLPPPRAVRVIRNPSSYEAPQPVSDRRRRRRAGPDRRRGSGVLGVRRPPRATRSRAAGAGQQARAACRGGGRGLCDAWGRRPDRDGCTRLLRQDLFWQSRIVVAVSRQRSPSPRTNPPQAPANPPLMSPSSSAWSRPSRAASTATTTSFGRTPTPGRTTPKRRRRRPRYPAARASRRP